MGNKNFKLLINAIKEYRNRIDQYTESDFLKKANPETWSAAEVYAHIISANRLTVKAMLKAAMGNATEDKSRLTWAAAIILLFERFPKGRKVPEVVEKRTPKIESIAQAIETTDALLLELNELMLTQSNWSKTQKFKHPVLGMLNNFQWIKFMKIHSNHHLKQLDRIKNL